MKKLLLALALGLPAQQASALNTLTTLIKDPWKALEYHLIEKPQLEASKFQYRAAKHGATGAAFLASLAAWQKLTGLIIDKNHDWYRSREIMHDTVEVTPLAQVVTATGTCVTSYLLYRAIAGFVPFYFEQKAFKSYVANWPTNKESAPKELAPVFDECYKYLQEDPAEFKRQAPEAYRLTRKAIEAQFPAKYAAATASNSDKSKTVEFSLNLSSIFGGLSDVVKSIKN